MNIQWTILKRFSYATVMFLSTLLLTYILSYAEQYTLQSIAIINNILSNIYGRYAEFPIVVSATFFIIGWALPEVNHCLKFIWAIVSRIVGKLMAMAKLRHYKKLYNQGVITEDKHIKLNHY